MTDGSADPAQTDTISLANAVGLLTYTRWGRDAQGALLVLLKRGTLRSWAEIYEARVDHYRNTGPHTSESRADRDDPEYNRLLEASFWIQAVTDGSISWDTSTAAAVRHGPAADNGGWRQSYIRLGKGIFLSLADFNAAFPEREDDGATAPASAEDDDPADTHAGRPAHKRERAKAALLAAYSGGFPEVEPEPAELVAIVSRYCATRDLKTVSRETVLRAWADLRAKP